MSQQLLTPTEMQVQGCCEVGEEISDRYVTTQTLLWTFAKRTTQAPR